jgi:hypothetical protein
VPLEGVQVHAYVVETMKGGDLTTFEIVTPTAESKKRFGIFVHTKKPNMYFQADTEVEAMEWLMLLRAITGTIIPIEKLAPRRYCNTEARAVFLGIPSGAGETPLHTMARLSTNSSEQATDEDKLSVLACLQWLVANECDPYALNEEGQTALEVAAQKDNGEFCEWLRELLSHLVRDTAGERPLLHPPRRLPGYSYVSIILQKHRHTSLAKYVEVTIYVSIHEHLIFSTYEKHACISHVACSLCILYSTKCKHIHTYTRVGRRQVWRPSTSCTWS